MSRLTASPFHKPSPFEFPRAPLSPPETTSDRTGPSPLAPTTISVLGGMPADSQHLDLENAPLSQSPEPAGARFRRVSTLAYHNSPLLREPRERTVQRASKSFVVVIPPAALLRERGQLGHTLSLGPAHRLSQGILMPLFPTMYGQLTAIAREYNFPSITGLCLYLHITENGFTASPRISDDTWQLIWSNVIDASAPPQRIPVVGKLEFDLDFRYARWYPSWMSSLQRDHLDVPASVVPSTAPSVAHYRGDSRTTDLEINTNDEQVDNNSVSPRSTVPTTRHVPRKLSLVDRLDTSARPVSRPTPQPTLSPPELEQSQAIQVLSPIFQEDEPKTAKLDNLEVRVNTWRASASLTPTALGAKGQTSLEPANLPNTMALDDVASAADDDELNLEDFTWSISSLGPNDWEEGTILSWDRLPSVHLANRLEGSVCATPSECTSFGPSDYTLPSPVPSMERILTPDIAYRMYEHVPPTPSTATSWGPPSEYPPSRISSSRASSVDIGERLVFSRPASPLTATSWGPGSWPPTPATPFYVRTPDAGERSFNMDTIETHAVPWEHASPSTSFAHPWRHVWPYISSSTVRAHAVQLPCVYPSLNIYPAVYPYFDLYPAEPSTNESVAYPNFNLYPAVNTMIKKRAVDHTPVMYPDFDLSVYPTSLDLDCQDQQSLVLHTTTAVTHGYPDFNIYPSLSPVQSKIDVVKAVSWNYPIFDLYPAVYPYILPYPSARIELGNTSRSISYPVSSSEPLVSEQRPAHSFNKPTWNYPIIDLYPAVYPYVAPYPSGSRPVVSVSTRPRTSDSDVQTTSVRGSQGYPDFELYPSIHGAVEKMLKSIPSFSTFDLHTAASSRTTNSSSKMLSVAEQATSHFYGYPRFDIYPSASVSGPRISSRFYGYPDFDIYPSASESVTQTSSHFYGYPDFDIYPLADLPVTLVPSHSYGYPDFDIYPSAGVSAIAAPSHFYGYPDFDIYPSAGVSAIAAPSHFYGYPDFDIYPSAGVSAIAAPSHFYGYPDFAIYPSMNRFMAQVMTHLHDPLDLDDCPSESLGKEIDVIVVKQSWGYPIFDLYPSVYPYITLYPSVRVEGAPVCNTDRVSGDISKYPCRGYPDFTLYPSGVGERPEMDVRDAVDYATKYPVIDIYPAVYPHIVPYPSVSAVTVAWPVNKSSSPVTNIALASSRKRLTHAELHAMVMLEGPWSKIPHKLHRSHRSLHDEVFTNGIVSTPSGVPQETNTSAVRALPVRHVARGSISTRPLSVAAPPPVRGLPPRPSHTGSEVSVHIEKSNHGIAAPTLPFTATLASSQVKPTRLVLGPASVESGPSVVGPPVGTTLRRAVSSASRLPLAKRVVTSNLAPVEESGSTLSRSSSMTLPSRRNDSSSVLSPPRKRDSLVLQRARAFENNDESSRISMSTVKEFPLPPRAPSSLPSRHSFLERSTPS